MQDKKAELAEYLTAGAELEELKQVSFFQKKQAKAEEEEENEIQVGDSVLHLNEKTHRIVNWTVQSLMNLLERLAASREASDTLPVFPPLTWIGVHSAVPPSRAAAVKSHQFDPVWL